MVKELPNKSSISLFEEKKIPFCQTCLKEVEEEGNKEYYNAFKSCKNCTGFEEAKFIFEKKIPKALSIRYFLYIKRISFYFFSMFFSN